MTLKTLLWGLALHAKAQGAPITQLATQPARNKTAVTARRRLSACAAGRAPLPGGGGGAEINGCWGAVVGDFAGWAAGWQRRLRCVRCACGPR